MKPFVRGLLVASVHLLLLLAVWGRYQYDRAKLPREWVKVQMVDPDSLQRGRYLVLRTTDTRPALQFEFFIPEHQQIPATLAPGEELWAEIGRAPNAPRPIQLGIRRDGRMTILVGE